MKKVNVFMVYVSVIFMFTAMLAKPVYSQKDMIDFLLETEVISNFKEIKSNLVVMLSENVNFESLTEDDYNKLKNEYALVRLKFESFINVIADDLKSKDSTKLMKKYPEKFLFKYENSFNNAADAYNNHFMPLYREIVFGEKQRSFFAGLIAAFAPVLIEKIIDVGVNFLIDQIVKRFVKPLLLPSWDDIVTKPDKFAEKTISIEQDEQLNDDVISAPILKNIEGEIKFVSHNQKTMNFQWKTKQNQTRLLEIGQPQTIFSNDYEEGDFFLSEDVFPQEFYFKINVKTNSNFYMFVFNENKNEIIPVYPFDKERELQIGHKDFVQKSADGFLSLPNDSLYFVTRVADHEYDYVVFLFTNTLINGKKLYNFILKEEGDINVRIENSFRELGISVSRKFSINKTMSEAIGFKSYNSEVSVLPLVFKIKRN